MSLPNRGRLSLIEACRAALPASVSDREREALEADLLALAGGGAEPPKRGRGFDWNRIGLEAGVDGGTLSEVREHLLPVLRAYARPAQVHRSKPLDLRVALGAARPQGRPGRRPEAVVAFPVASPEPWD